MSIGFFLQLEFLWNNNIKKDGSYGHCYFLDNSRLELHFGSQVEVIVCLLAEDQLVFIYDKTAEIQKNFPDVSIDKVEIRASYYKIG